MRLRNVEISETGILELDIMELPERCVLVIDQGRARYAELHPHAETKIITNKGKVARVRFEEGEDF